MLSGFEPIPIDMKIAFLFAIAFLGAGSLQAQETAADHAYIIKYATDFGRVNAASWRAYGDAPDSPQIVQELAEIMVGWGYTNPSDIAEFVHTAQAAAFKADATMDTITGQQQ
jgi:hypothetical protein